MKPVRCLLRIRFGGIVVERERRAIEMSRLDLPYALKFDLPEGAQASLAFERLSSRDLSIWSVRSVELPASESTR